MSDMLEHEQDAFVPIKLRTELWVNTYSVGRGFGGHEEGGWWFDTGVPISSVYVNVTPEEWGKALDAAHEDVELRMDEGEDLGWREIENIEREHLNKVARTKAEKVRDEWRARFPDTGKRSSVLGGDDYEVVIQSHFARAYPETKPRYE